jgi:uncharacterized protein
MDRCHLAGNRPNAANRRTHQRRLQRYTSVRRAVLFGSRAKGTARPESDVDLALEGEISPDEAARIAFDLDDLPLPFRFDVQSLSSAEHDELRRHIDRVGLELFRKA